jgi:hypothetical protein
MEARCTPAYGLRELPEGAFTMKATKGEANYWTRVARCRKERTFGSGIGIFCSECNLRLSCGVTYEAQAALWPYDPIHRCLPYEIPN